MERKRSAGEGRGEKRIYEIFRDILFLRRNSDGA